MTRIICHYEVCIFNRDTLCTAKEIEYDPDQGCLTAQDRDEFEGVVDDEDGWDEEEELEPDEELEADEVLDEFEEDDLDEEDEDEFFGNGALEEELEDEDDF